VGIGAAAELCTKEIEHEAPRLRAWRDKLEDGIAAGLDGVGVTINGNRTQRIPHTSNMSFSWVEGESLMMAIKEVAVSSGSACTSASLEPSYVLKSLGVGDELAHSSIRFGLGRFNTEEEVDYVIAHVTEAVRRLREMSPLYEMAKEGVDPAKAPWAAR
jgi:cysteine desulfurase